MFSSRLVLAGDLVNNMENKHLLVLHISVQKCHISHLSNSKEAIYSSADLKTTEEELKLMFEFLLELQVNLTETRVQLSRPPESETLSDKLSPDRISQDRISPVLWCCGSLSPRVSSGRLVRHSVQSVLLFQEFFHYSVGTVLIFIASIVAAAKTAGVSALVAGSVCKHRAAGAPG